MVGFVCFCLVLNEKISKGKSKFYLVKTTKEGSEFYFWSSY